MASNGPTLPNLKPSRWADWRADLFAGLTVALVGLPQCLAYAMMSGLPPEYGLVTAAIPGFVAALVGRSAWVITGPTNTTGLLILAALAAHLGDNGFITAAGLPLLASLTLLAGLLRLAMVVSGGLVLVRYIPESVLVGFTAGAGILIGVMQFDEALGLPPVRGSNSIGEFYGLANAFGAGLSPGIPAVLVTVLSIAAVMLGKKFAPRWPVALLTVLAGIAVAFVFDLNAADGLPLVGDRSPVPSGWPAGAMPTFDPAQVAPLIVPALAITLLGTMELLVSVRADGSRPDMGREVTAQGWANIAGAFTASFPASASLTRSALLRLGHAHSRVAAMIAALAVLPVMLFGGTFVAYIPQASLAGVLLITAYGMIDRARVFRSWRASIIPRILMTVTLFATLLLPLEWAILLGAGLGIVFHLGEGSAPRVRLLVPRGDSFGPRLADESPDVAILEVSGAVHYAAIEPFTDSVRELVPKSAKLVVIDLTHAHQMRLAAIDAFQALRAEFTARGVDMRVCGVSSKFAILMKNAGCTMPFTPDDPVPLASLRRCLAASAPNSAPPASPPPLPDQPAT